MNIKVYVLLMRMFRNVPNIVCICLKNEKEREWKIDTMNIDSSQSLAIGSILNAIKIKISRVNFRPTLTSRSLLPNEIFRFGIALKIATSD